MTLIRFMRRRSVLPYTALGLLATGAAAALITYTVLDWDSLIAPTIAVFAGVSSLAGLGLTVFMFVISRTDAGSFQQITEGVRRLEGGEFGHRVALTPPTRARELAEAFNQMSAAVDARVRELETERHQMAIAINTMADGVVVIDSESTITLINPAAEWLLGVNAQTAPNRPLAQVVRDPEVLRLASAAAATREVGHADIDLLHHRRFLSIIATPVSGHGGDDVLLTLRDVTRLKQIETTRREFVSNVSHELRSPLASANAMVEVLEAGAKDDQEIAYDFLRRIRDDISRMTSLVDELLELSSLESGHMPIHLAPVRLADVVEEVVSRFSFSASSGAVEFVDHIPDDLPYVMAEKRKLEQVLTNLVENALKFTQDGGRITLAAAADTQWVTVVVSDTGVGIPREHLPHIFERFYKVDRSRRDQGTGLGLAISKHLVQAHGGEIRATSIEGEGSQFTLKLRRAT